MLWVCGTTAVALSGCGQGGPTAPAATADCGQVDFPGLQSGSHLIGDIEPPVPYNSTPPTSGWHRSGAPPAGVFSEPLPEPAQVSTLEAGGVVVTYHDLADEDLQMLQDMVRTRYADRVALTSYDAIEPGSIAFTSWGALQHCDALDLDALDSYVADYASPIEVHS